MIFFAFSCSGLCICKARDSGFAVTNDEFSKANFSIVQPQSIHTCHQQIVLDINLKSFSRAPRLKIWNLRKGTEKMFLLHKQAIWQSILVWGSVCLTQTRQPKPSISPSLLQQESQSPCVVEYTRSCGLSHRERD